MIKIKPLYWAFFIGIIFPTALSVSAGGLRLTLYRVSLLLFLVSCVSKYKRFCTPSLRNPAFLLLLYSVLAAVSLAVNHGLFAKVESSGIYFVEVVGPFLLTLTFCNSVERIYKIVRVYLICVCLTLLVTLPETLTGFNWVYKILGQGQPEEIGARLGLHRSYGTFDHPILQGVFASTSVALAWFSRRYFFFVGALFATITSVSSGAILSVFIQFMLIGWERVTRSMNRRWLVLLLCLGAGYVGIALFSNRPPMNAILSNLTLSSQTAYWRMNIWDFGMQNVWQNPIFGIGLNEWVRPAWMHSSSIDAFWLVSMMRYGLPAFICYAGAFAIVIYKLFRSRVYDKKLRQIRRGWLTGMVGLVVSCCTVHLWNNSFVFINFYLGLGAAILLLLQKQSRALIESSTTTSHDDSFK